ncbi:hypothetical protein HMPREF0308_1853, partial [Corynebacterium striatum ATCC 6940]
GDILKVLGATDIEGELFDSLDIVIKPKFKRDIKRLPRILFLTRHLNFQTLACGQKMRPEIF